MEAFYVSCGDGRILRLVGEKQKYGSGVVLAPPELERGVGVGEEPPVHVAFFASLAGPLLRRCAVCVTHCVWRIEGFAGFDCGTEVGPACASCFAETISGLHIAVVKFQDFQVPKAHEGL